MYGLRHRLPVHPHSTPIVAFPYFHWNRFLLQATSWHAGGISTSASSPTSKLRPCVSLFFSEREREEGLLLCSNPPPPTPLCSVCGYVIQQLEAAEHISFFPPTVVTSPCGLHTLNVSICGTYRMPWKWDLIAIFSPAYRVLIYSLFIRATLLRPRYLSKYENHPVRV